MPQKDSLPENESKPIQIAARAEEQGGKSQADEAASPLVVKPVHSEAEERKPSERRDETDRKQDESAYSRAEQTEIAQQTGWMAKQTTWMRRQFYATIALGALTLAILVFHGIIFSKQQTAAQGQLDVVRKQFEITDRAWLYVSVIPANSFVFRGDNANVSAQYIVKNIGRSVATGVTINAKVIFVPWGDAMFKEPVNRQKQLCENIAREQVDNAAFPSTAITIFPNDTNTFGTGFGFSKQEMEANRMPNSNSAIPILIGCVDYMLGGQSSHHQTGFIYEIEVLDPAEDPNHSHAVRIGQDVPADKLVFEKYLFGGDYAN